MPPPSISVGGGNVWNNTLAPTVSVTTAATDYILVLSVYNEHTGTAAATVTSVTSAGMTWALRKRSNGSATGGLEVWWAHGTGALSAYSVTINMSGAHDDAAASICVVTGANSAAPWDTNGSLPAAQSGSSVTYTPSLTGLSTSAANDLLLYFTGSVGPTGAWTPPTGYTNTDRHTFGGGSWACMLSVDSQQVTATQSGITVTGGTALTNPFSGTVTCGEVIFDAIVAAAAPTTWNPSDLVNVTLTGSNLIATGSGAQGAVRAIDRKITGKFYWETTYNTTNGANTGAGLAAQGAALSTLASTPTQGVIVYRSGNIWNNNVNTSLTLGTIANGTVVCHAFDATDNLYWARSGAAGNWNGNANNNPATGVGGITPAWGPPGFPLYPVATFNATAGEQITGNFGATAFSGAVPSGFTSGWDNSTNPALNLVGSQYAVEAFGSLGSSVAMQATQVVAEVWYSTAPIVSASGAFVVIMA